MMTCGLFLLLWNGCSLVRLSHKNDWFRFRHLKYLIRFRKRWYLMWHDLHNTNHSSLLNTHGTQTPVSRGKSCTWPIKPLWLFPLFPINTTRLEGRFNKWHHGSNYSVRLRRLRSLTRLQCWHVGSENKQAVLNELRHFYVSVIYYFLNSVLILCPYLLMFKTSFNWLCEASAILGASVHGLLWVVSLFQ